LEEIRIDDEKVDAVIRQEADHALYDGVSIDVQLKCTTQKVVNNGYASWTLKKDHYDKLRAVKRYHPRILVLMLVPEDLEEWVVQDEEQLRLVKCAYWTDLVGMPGVATDTKTVKLPTANLFNVEQLLGILSRVGSGGEP
jgi:hypothetical protein